MNRRTLFQAIGATGLAAIAGRERANAAELEATPHTAAGNEAVCGQTVSLRLHESVTTASGVSIRLAGIKDHRCPADVACVWAGYAQIWLDLAGPRWEERGYPATEYITVDLEDEGVRRYGSFVLILDSLSPTPRPRIETSPDEYEVGLVLIELSPRSHTGQVAMAHGKRRVSSSDSTRSAMSVERNLGRRMPAWTRSNRERA